MGTIELDLNEFLNEKINRRDYYKYFSGKLIDNILSWGLDLSIGFSNDKAVDVTRLKLTDHSGVYIPMLDYFTCEALPVEWISQLI